MRRHHGPQYHRTTGDHLQPGDFFGERSRTLHLRDAVELGRERLHAEGIEPRDVHARSVEVAHLLRRRALCCRRARPRHVLQQVTQLCLDGVLHHEIAGDLQLVGGDLRRVEPAAARVAPEVLPRIGRGVHLRRREPKREAEVAGRVGRRGRCRICRLGRGRASRQQQRRGRRQRCAENQTGRDRTAHSHIPEFGVKQDGVASVRELRRTPETVQRTAWSGLGFTAAFRFNSRIGRWRRGRARRETLRHDGKNHPSGRRRLSKR